MNMSAEIELQVGQWYRRRDGEIVYCFAKNPVNVIHPYHLCCEDGTFETCTEDGDFCVEADDDDEDIVEHLPDCTGFDWEPPKPIELPKPKYRPFKDGAEFKPFRDKWVKYKQSDVGKTMLCVSFSNEGVTACVSFMPYKTAFDSLVFEDGSPFGVLDDGT
jgi:hypothetical protein